MQNDKCIGITHLQWQSVFFFNQPISGRKLDFVCSQLSEGSKDGKFQFFFYKKNQESQKKYWKPNIIIIFFIYRIYNIYFKFNKYYLQKIRTQIDTF